MSNRKSEQKSNTYTIYDITHYSLIKPQDVEGPNDEYHLRQHNKAGKVEITAIYHILIDRVPSNVDLVMSIK